ncbi:SSU ribosomal protein S20p [Candidatus Phytoplasma rubi]|uniref:Small ribosomal subunit protein bS20 n=1 Tax=Candidatus Phytoplasma rubi TaxID=399025 RepID=A0ABY7BVC5_9MOLU|nr:30S ribosomal protein S20 [Candidatus Phytoplasma rubi]WAN63554.1 SSU ribosomal protein S20p [Candidatus Phytoplasma rubi]
MANIKQQKKRVKTDAKRRLKRKSYKSKMRTLDNNFNKFIASADKEKAVVFFNKINGVLDKGVSKGIYHKNFVSRNKSKISKLLNSILK